MLNRLTLHLILAGLLALAGLMVARGGAAVVLSREDAGLLMILAAVVLMFWTIRRHVAPDR